MAVGRGLGHGTNYQHGGAGNRFPFSMGDGMETLITFISAHWLEWLFTAVLATLSWLFRGLRAQLREEHDRNEAIAAGVQALLRESIVNGYNRYSDKGYCFGRRLGSGDE